MIAQLRGARFEYSTYGDKNYSPHLVKDQHIAKEALRDVSEWLGFETRSSYLHSERHEIVQILQKLKGVP